MLENEQKDVEQQAPETDSKFSIRCERCGRSVAVAPITVATEVMQDYVRSMLAQRRFTRTVTLFNGAVSIELEALSAEQDKSIRTLMLDSKNTVQNILDTRIAGCLASVKLMNTELHTAEEIYSADYDKRKALTSGVVHDIDSMLPAVDVVLRDLIKASAVTFLALCNAIAEQMIDNDFYTGAGLL